MREQGIYDKPNLGKTVEGILYRMRTGLPWRDLPSFTAARLLWAQAHFLFMRTSSATGLPSALPATCAKLMGV